MSNAAVELFIVLVVLLS